MQKQQYLDVVATEGAGLLAAAGHGLDAVAPVGDGWPVESIVGHTGWVHRYITAHVERRATERVPPEEVDTAPEGDAVLAWYEEGLGRLLEALDGIGADEPIWTWTADQTGNFYQRRMANETAIHRRDTESAHRIPHPLDPELAADGISEQLEVLFPEIITRFGVELPVGSLHLHRTDGEGEWLARVEDGRIVSTREHAKGDAAVRGSSEALVLLLLERVSLDDEALELFGDAEVVRSWTAVSR